MRKAENDKILISPEEIKEAKKKFYYGKLREEIAYEMGVSRTTLERRISRTGEGFTEYRNKEIARQWESGKTLTEISEETGISIRGLRERLWRMDKKNVVVS